MFLFDCFKWFFWIVNEKCHHDDAWQWFWNSQVITNCIHIFRVKRWHLFWTLSIIENSLENKIMYISWWYQKQFNRLLIQFEWHFSVQDRQSVDMKKKIKNKFKKKQQKTLSSNEKKNVVKWKSKSDEKKNEKKIKKKVFKNTVLWITSVKWKSIKFNITIFLISNCSSDIWFLIYVKFRSKGFHLSKQKKNRICFMFSIA